MGNANRWTTGLVTGGIVLATLCGCHETQGPSESSGSNWLTCDRLSDCQSPEAAACDDAGYCVDAEGERIATDKNGGEDGGPAPDAAPDTMDGEPDGPNTMDGEPGFRDLGPPQAMCAWGVDAQLAEVGVLAPDRVNCGLEPYWRTEGVRSGFACFDAAIADMRAVEFTVNLGIDSLNPATFVAMLDGARFALYWEEDMAFGDDLRESRVVVCDEIFLAQVLDEDRVMPTCLGEAEAYACNEPVSIERELPTPIPVTPRKVSDVSPAGEDVTTLHLYVSNQSSQEPLVDISVEINGTQVVTGDFPVEDQRNWIGFDVQVPVGQVDLYAVTFRPDSANSQGFDGIEIAGETWGVLTFSGGFSFSTSDAPPDFK